jgi:citrate lyase subunit beta / citryl-CoA lyase
MQPARSLLFVPGNRERFLEKALGLPADAILLDLEDGVPIAEKTVAREMIGAWSDRFGRPTWVRVNGVESGLLEADLAALVAAPGLAGIMLPKTEDRALLEDLDATLRRLEGEQGRPGPGLAVIAQIESALGVLSAYAIASAPRVASLCLGGAREGDLQTDLGADWSIDGPELLYARQHVLLAARAARISWPLDGVFGDVSDSSGFQRDTTLSRRLGYRGRTVIHPGQIDLANRLYAPSERELADARRVVAAFEEAEGQGRATTTVDGRLIDYAMVRRAQTILESARLFEPMPRSD